MATKALCKIPHCDKPTVSLGWCNAHYLRYRNHGDPLGGRSRVPDGTHVAFLKGVVKQPPAGCVLWPFVKTSGGYGTLKIDGDRTTAHRAAWELYYGRKMRKGMHAAHEPIVCHSRACVNPLHVREDSPAGNNADKVVDGTHNRGGRHWGGKLTDDDVLAIRADTRVQSEIAADFGVTQPTVSEIKSGRSWAWLA